jgi:aminopeptidase N
MLADPDESTGGLTAAEAAARSAQVEVHGYQVELDLTGLQRGLRFTSRTVIDFGYGTPDGAGGPAMTWVDLIAEEVSSVKLDGVVLDPGDAVRGNRVRVGPLGGRHRLEVTARHRTDVPGRGLSRSIDPADGGVYAWTQFQPFDARRAFACFDQPDLKATFAFTVRVPLDWLCVSGRLASSVTEDGDAAVWTFPPTPRLPTYATAVCAGPFHLVRTEAAAVPMALYARRSLAVPLERSAPEIFGLSRRALELFGSAFGKPYDGDSYDHVFLPDQPGAMENHGCVTWNDQVLFRSEPTAEQRRRRALVQLHEMAHMWFGNLVTPQWWDGLWLSESFADWAAQWAAAELGVLDGRWSVATALEKDRAAGADQLASTHPVSRPVPDLAAAEADFDLITYAKGACMLRQLVGLVGEPAFLAGLRLYFHRHAGGNGSLVTLLAAIADGTPLDLAGWSREWLETSGINTVSLQVSTAGNRYTSAALIQGPADALRRHDISIAVYRSDPTGELRLVDRFDLAVTGERTDVPVLIGTPVADLLLLDDTDRAYATLRPDERSVRALVTAGGRLTDPVARTVARRTVRGLLRDAALPAADVVEYVATALPAERDLIHLRALAELGVEAAGPFAPASQRESLQRRLAAACVDALAAAKVGADDWLVLVEALADFADSADQLRSLLAGGDVPQPIRWRLLTRLVAIGSAQAEEIRAEQTGDDDPDAFWYAAAARAAAPEPAAKDVGLDLLLTGEGVPAAVLRIFGPALWQPRQSALLAAGTVDFVDRLTGFGRQAGWPAAHRVALFAFPTVGIDDAFVQRVLAIAAAPELPPLMRKVLRDQAEQSRRILAAQHP